MGFSLYTRIGNPEYWATIDVSNGNTSNVFLFNRLRINKTIAPTPMGSKNFYIQNITNGGRLVQVDIGNRTESQVGSFTDTKLTATRFEALEYIENTNLIYFVERVGPAAGSPSHLCTITISSSPVFTVIGETGSNNIIVVMAYDPTTSTMFIQQARGGFYTMDLSNGDRTLISNFSPEQFDGLAVHPTTGVLYGLLDGEFVTINKQTGALSVIKTGVRGSELFFVPDTLAAPNIPTNLTLVAQGNVVDASWMKG